MHFKMFKMVFYVMFYLNKKIVSNFAPKIRRGILIYNINLQNFNGTIAKLQVFVCKEPLARSLVGLRQ